MVLSRAGGPEGSLPLPAHSHLTPCDDSLTQGVDGARASHCTATMMPTASWDDEATNAVRADVPASSAVLAQQRQMEAAMNLVPSRPPGMRAR
eukprot:350190-Chlamydomonas_euryale.AAC.4